MGFGAWGATEDGSLQCGGEWAAREPSNCLFSADYFLLILAGEMGF